MSSAAALATESERWPAQSFCHQSIVSNLLFLFRLFLRDHSIARAVPAPVDVVLPGIASPVQPDLVVVASDRIERIVEERVEGAPDLLVEVLSPSNWLSDRREKYAAYAQAGVREYWIVDPAEETVEVFVLRRDSYGLLGKYGPEERVRSQVLAGFEPAVEDVFDV